MAALQKQGCSRVRQLLFLVALGGLAAGVAGLRPRLILATLRLLQLHVLALNAQAAMGEIERTTGRDSNHADCLRRRYAETGRVQGVVRASVDALRQDLD